MQILDGVYPLEQNGLRFHRVGAPETQNLGRLLNRLIRRIVRKLTRDGISIQDSEQSWLDLCAGNPAPLCHGITHRLQRSAGRTSAPSPTRKFPIGSPSTDEPAATCPHGLTAYQCAGRLVTPRSVIVSFHVGVCGSSSSRSGRRSNRAVNASWASIRASCAPRHR